MTFDVGWKVMAHPTLTSRSIIGSAMGTFLFAANLFSFVIAVRCPTRSPTTAAENHATRYLAESAASLT
jgi:hypothetical protein